MLKSSGGLRTRGGNHTPQPIASEWVLALSGLTASASHSFLGVCQVARSLFRRAFGGLVAPQGSQACSPKARHLRKLGFSALVMRVFGTQRSMLGRRRRQTGT